MPQQMQPGVCQRVRSVQGLPAAPRPELVHTGRGQPFRALVPELKMHFNSQRAFRIEMTPAAPLPSGFVFQAEDGIRDTSVTGVQTCALPISAQYRKRTAEDATDAKAWYGLGTA